MSDRGDWLFDGTGTPDPEVERYERLLSRFAHDENDAPPLLERPRVARRAVLVSTVAAAAAAVMLFVFWPEPEGYAAFGLARERVRVGDRIVAERAAAIEIAELGRLNLEPGARLRIGNDAATEHAFFLERGRVSAFILAEPRVLSIGTPAGLTVDLGCQYTIDVAEDGSSVLAVQSGRVAFEVAQREVIVPAGASTVARPNGVPLVPVFEDADAEWVAAVRAIEGELEPTEEEIARVVDTARAIDGLTLFHLAALGASPALRQAAHERLRADIPEPPGGAGLSSGDPEARAAWLARLKLDWRF